MKVLNREQMVVASGGQSAFMVGVMCSATLVLAFSGFLAPLAGATGAGCLTGLAALRYWKSQGLDVNEIQ